MRKNRLMALALCAALVLSMVGCSSGNTNSSSSTAGDASSASASGASEEAGSATNAEATTIYVWSNDAHNKDLFVEQIENYNNNEGKEAGIVIDYSVYGTDYYSTLDVAIQAGEAPHIFKCNKIPQYAQSGHIVALDDLPGGSDIIDTYAAFNSVGVGIVDDKTYAVPFKETAMGLAYNKELFDSLGLTFPETYEEMRECARIITENGNGQIYGYGLGMSYVSYGLYFVLPMASASTGSMHFNNGTGQYQFSALLPYMNHLLDIINDGSMFPGYETMDDDTKRAQFAAGTIGMIPVFSSDVGVLTTQFPATFEWGVGPYPVETKGQRYKMYSNPSTFYVFNSRVVDEGVEDKAMAVMKMFLSDDFQLKLYEGEKDLITRTDLKEKADTTGISEQWKEFGDASYRYTGFGFPDGLLTIEGDTYKDAFDKILTGLVDPAEALADLDTRYNAALEKAVADGTLVLEDYIVEDYDTIVKY